MSELHVVFKVAGVEYAISAASVVQMDAFTGATPVPGAAVHVAGLVQVRGRVMPLVSMRARIGLAATEPTIESRIVVGRLAGPRGSPERHVALLVDSAREVVRLAPEQIEPPPRLVGDDARGLVIGVARIETRLLMLVDFANLIGDEAVHGKA